MADATPTSGRNRFDLAELAGAFGDLGTLIPFVVAYVSILRIDPTGLLLGVGGALIAAGLVYRTPVPVQPMKAIGAIAIAQTAGSAVLTPAMVVAAGLVTGLVWLLLAVSGLATKLARLVPPQVLIGIVMGLGFSFMREGIAMMGQNAWLAAAVLALALVLLARSRLPAMLVLLLMGVAVALCAQPTLADRLALIRPDFRLPSFAWPSLAANDLWQGALLLALPQLPLTFGNGLVALVDENNREFADRPIDARRVALTTGLMNVWSSAIGGIPMCHGAGGMAGHVRFGARTGGASILLGGLLVVMALGFGDSLLLILQLFPAPVLGVVLFLAGAELAISGRTQDAERGGRFVVLTTAALATWHVGIAALYGCLFVWAARRGWIRA